MRFDRPIEPEKYGVYSFNVKGNGCGELHVEIPLDADSFFMNQLHNCTDGDYTKKILPGGRKKIVILTSTGIVSDAKKRLFACLIRGWKEKTGVFSI